MKTFFIVAAGIFLTLLISQTNGAIIVTPYDLSSPDGRIQIKIQTGERVTYDVIVNGSPLLTNSTLSLDVDHKTLGVNASVKSAEPSAVDRDIQSPVPQKSAKIHEAYKELRLEMDGNYAIVFRAYNEGIAYRFETSLPQPNVKVYSEDITLNFNGDYSVYYP